MNTIIKKDLFRFVGNDCNKLLVQIRFIFFTAGFRYTYFYRKAQIAKFSLSRIFWKFMTRQCMLRTGIQIPIDTKIDEGLRIVHFGHIVINPDAIIGKNFNINQGCLIGNAKGKHEGVPTIGNNVFMSANSIIIGNVHVGNDVLIAPGAFINFDVPENSIVIGNPGKIIKKDSSPTEKYIVYAI